MAIKIDLTSFKDLFIDPISHKRMKDPVLSSVCGHTFERKQITGWVNGCKEKGGESTCPLDRSLLAINNLAPNRFIYNALWALKKLEENHGSLNCRISTETKNEDEAANLLAIDTDGLLTEEETEHLSGAADAIWRRRDADKEKNIPDRLEPSKDYDPDPGPIYDCLSKKFSC